MEQPQLGKKILELRLSKGLTQNELAEKCKVSLRTIQRIEMAEVTPRSFTIKSIFSALDYDFYNANDQIKNEKTSSLQIWFLDFINLKKNTMRKVSFLSLLVVTLILFLNKSECHAQSINGWVKRTKYPESYETGLNASESKTGKKCAYIKSVGNKVKDFATLMQCCDAKLYLGKRVKLTGYVKGEGIKGWSGMWFRIDSKYDKKVLGFDNMRNRAIEGDTDWQKCEIILDVPSGSGLLNYGVLLSGKGTVYFDRISLEIIGDIATDNPAQSYPVKPSNVDFED